jgi:hypothetical protein
MVGDEMNQRGSVGAYLVFSIVVAGAAGYGAYHYIREHKSQFQSDESVTTTTAPSPTKPAKLVKPTPAPDPIAEPAVPVAPEETPSETPAMLAAEKAIDPIVDPSEYDTPKFGTPGIVGGIERGSVDRRFKPHADQLQRCYEHASPFDGAVRVTLEVAPTGKLSRISLDRGDDGFQACAISVLDITFSPTKDGKPATIVQPIHFQ